MAKDLKLKSGAEYLPKYNWEIGMNDDVAYSDRAGWTTSVEMLTGGRSEDAGVFSGLEVGNQYDLDPMGEERGMTTFAEGDGPMAKGMIGMMAAEVGSPMQPTQRTSGGKNVDIQSPQNYNDVGQMKRANLVPSVSEKQREAAAIAEHHPEKLHKENKGMLGMSKSQLSDFASKPMKYHGEGRKAHGK